MKSLRFFLGLATVSAFFAPGVLRAIMTYNAAMLKRIDEEVWSSQDWGVPAGDDAAGDGLPVLEHPAFPPLIAALRQREAGEDSSTQSKRRPPSASCIDRLDRGRGPRGLSPHTGDPAAIDGRGWLVYCGRGRSRATL